MIAEKKKAAVLQTTAIRNEPHTHYNNQIGTSKWFSELLAAAIRESLRKGRRTQAQYYYGIIL